LSTVIDYLAPRREAFVDRSRGIADGSLRPLTLNTKATADGRSGVRRIGGLASCLNHSYLIQAVALEVPIESIEGTIDPRVGSPGYETTPVYPQNIAYVVRIDGPASVAEIQTLRDNVEKFCPILNLLRQPQTIEGRLDLRSTAPAAAAE